MVFSICHCHCLLISNLRNASSNVLDIQNKMFFLNFGLANPNLSSFLGSIQWKIVKQLKMVISINFSHNETINTNFFKYNNRNACRNIFDMCNKVFSINLDMTNPNPSTFLGNVQWKLAKKWKTVISKVVL